jgi:hypothetical protein
MGGAILGAEVTLGIVGVFLLTAKSKSLYLLPCRDS